MLLLLLFYYRRVRWAWKSDKRWSRVFTFALITALNCSRSSSLLCSSFLSRISTVQCLVVASLVSLLCFSLYLFRIHFRVRANYDKLCFPISFRLPFRRSTEGSALCYGSVKKRVKLRVIEIMYKLMNLRMVEVCTPRADQATKRWWWKGDGRSRSWFAWQVRILRWAKRSAESGIPSGD